MKALIGKLGIHKRIHGQFSSETLLMEAYSQGYYRSLNLAWREASLSLGKQCRKYLVFGANLG